MNKTETLHAMAADFWLIYVDALHESEALTQMAEDYVDSHDELEISESDFASQYAQWLAQIETPKVVEKDVKRLLNRRGDWFVEFEEDREAGTEYEVDFDEAVAGVTEELVYGALEGSDKSVPVGVNKEIIAMMDDYMPEYLEQ